MNRLWFAYGLIIALLVSGCGVDLVRKPDPLLALERYTSNGLKAYSNGRWQPAHYFFSKALRLQQSIDDQEGVLRSRINLAETALATHDYANSKRHLKRATTIADAGLQQYRPRINLVQSLVALQQKQLAEAKHLLQDSLPLFNGVTTASLPNDTELAALASRTTLAFLQQQQASLWTQRYTNALQQISGNNLNHKARLLRFQARLLWQQGVGDKAEEKMQQALALYQQNLSRVGMAASLFELAEYYQARHRWQQAQQYLNRSKGVYDFLQDTAKVKQINQLLATIEPKIAR